MADFNSSLPVRTQNNGDVVIQIVDGTTPSQKAAVDTSGGQIIAGEGIAGTPAGGVVSVQGVTGGTPVPISGTVTATNPSVGLTGAAPPADATYIGALAATSSPSLTSGDMYPLSLTLAGAVRVDGSAVTQPVSGTVAVTQSTSPWITKDVADGSVTGGTAGTFSQLAGGIYNSTPPTLTTGQQASLQLNASGALITTASVTLSYDENYGTVGASTLRTASQIGNATGAADFNAGATGAQTLRVQANQGAAAALSAAWPVEITDGTNVLGTSSHPIIVTTSNFPTTLDTNYGTVGANTLRGAAQIGNATGAADFNNGATGAQTLRVAANLAVGGANVSATNPVPVIIESPASPGTPKNYYTDSASVAIGATATQSTTAAGATGFYLQSILVSGSGKFKAVVSIGGTPFFAAFNSTATPSFIIPVPNDTLVATGTVISVAMTNLDLAAQDLYSTLTGYQV